MDKSATEQWVRGDETRSDIELSGRYVAREMLEYGGQSDDLPVNEGSEMAALGQERTPQAPVSVIGWLVAISVGVSLWVIFFAWLNG